MTTNKIENVKKLVDKLHPLERKVLPVILKSEDFDKIIDLSELTDVEVMRAIQWLQNKNLVTSTEETNEILTLGSNGQKYIKKGLPERRLLQIIVDENSSEILLSQISKNENISQDEINITIGMLRKRAAIDIVKLDSDLKIILTEHGKTLAGKEFIEEKFIQKNFPIYIKNLSDEDKFAYNELIKRKDILKKDIEKIKTVKLTEKGIALLKLNLNEDYIERLTPTIIKSGIWKQRKFRNYDVEINVPEIYGGKRHIVDQGINYIKRIWLDLGFTEMKGNQVQTSFWDLDALFVPQDHPARDMQDTFYIKDPKYGKLDKKFVDKIKATHENGWTTKSSGWKYKWSEDIAKENLLRTHTTVLSAKTLSQLKKENLPAKFFSIKKVFRNETLSWKHLFEFVQVEGIVIDPDANFKHLIGYLKNFFAKLGFPDARVRPAHFPYTEPSAEVDVWHPKKKKWIELGGAGIFRPEVVKPLMGIDVPVLAWGIGLERSITDYYNITDLRDIYKNDLKQLRGMKQWMKL